MIGRPPTPDEPRPFRTRPRTLTAVALLLSVHLTLAVSSLVRENPTVDEVVHLPAGISYWQKGTFRLYRHNPPLVKLAAALPVLRTGVTDPLYESSHWRQEPPNKAGFAHEFAFANAPNYFELFARARLPMPLFSIVGGLVVFAWSRMLYGNGGGLLSLALWCFCPNILAHSRLITTDVAATSLGVLATFLFWLYLRRPTWSRASLAGFCLGLAQLTKFSLLLLYGVWPLLWLGYEMTVAGSSGRARRLGRSTLQAAWIVGLSILTIDLGYGFEGVGRRLGDFQFVSVTLTRPRVRPVFFDPRPNSLVGRIREYRINRFQGTVLAKLPAPLPEHYLLGFDDQKLEADGVRKRFLVPSEIGDRMGSSGEELAGYPVYLDGQIRDRSWWDYYLRALLYKVPEGTWALVATSWLVLVFSRRTRAAWFDEATLLAVPVVVLVIMSAFTNINLGLRYVLGIFPYVLISVGKVVPWALGRASQSRRRLATAGVALALAATVGSTLAVHPHYIAYFNLVSGGPAHGSEHLIDSNLDWGQDLAGLKRWLDRNAPGERVGIAYFGQINPELFTIRHRAGVPEPELDWFLPPPLPGTLDENFLSRPPRYRRPWSEIRLKPGLYAVSATLLRGLPWRVYDSDRWAPWNARAGAFAYFRELQPIDRIGIGYSILLFRVSSEDADRLAHYWIGDKP